MIKKIKSIENLAVFQGFDWDKSVLDSNGRPVNLSQINVIYGRNYSGKTTLSRIFMAMDAGAISDKYESPKFTLEFNDGTQVNQGNLKNHGKKIRVFNEDFIKDNLKFIANPDENIESFAILGDDNNAIEKEIAEIQLSIGIDAPGNETGLFAIRKNFQEEYQKCRDKLRNSEKALNDQIDLKATGDRKNSIKYQASRFGDQNYNSKKLTEQDIPKVLMNNWVPITNEEKVEKEKLVAEQSNAPIPELTPPLLNFSSLRDKAKVLIEKPIAMANKIEELVKMAVLNRWVNEGRTHHRDKRDDCAFCGNQIPTGRWEILDRHFDVESEKLDSDIQKLLNDIAREKVLLGNGIAINNSIFYAQFHVELDELSKANLKISSSYLLSLNTLEQQLKDRKMDLLNYRVFNDVPDGTSEVLDLWEKYDGIRKKSNEFTRGLKDAQDKARDLLRLREVSDFVSTTQYSKQKDDIDKTKNELASIEAKGKANNAIIKEKQELIEQKRKLCNDEEKGALKVNEYLNHYFGNKYLSLNPVAHQSDGSEEKTTKFEVVRNGSKAYHLSEGECSLLAFCYFLAKLSDIETNDHKPVIWIDDPISSLDSNHVFFIYSLIYSEIVGKSKFEQIFISTHNLEFLKYLKRLKGFFNDNTGKKIEYTKLYLLVNREENVSTVVLMPEYLKKYVTEFNYLFEQIYKCSQIERITDKNFTTFYNFGNNSRKFLEIYLCYKYPDFSSDEDKYAKFFGQENIPIILNDRLNNEYSHLTGLFERGATPVEVPEMQKAAKLIIDRLKLDGDQYNSLLRSIGVEQMPAPLTT